MKAHYNVCQTDAELARYASFFIRNRTELSKDCTLQVVLMHMLDSLPASKVILIKDDEGHVIGWGQFEYRAPDTIYVDSVIIEKKHRSTRVFLDGFRYLARHILEQYPQAGQLTFRALSGNAYVNRLYSKFAVKTEELDGTIERETYYKADLRELLFYLRIRK